jgi:uncharacterized protein involved in type VI secretion and phage assembly
MPTSDPDLYGVFHGTVVDREDPEVLGRVRVLIPGVIEPASEWALPDGTAGGGSAGRGKYAVPEKGADIFVQFLMGDPDRPIYRPGHWGKPDGQTEAPTYLAGMSKTDGPNVRVEETKNFLLVFDDRAGHEQILIKDKNNAAGLIRIAGGKVYAGDESADEPFVKGNQWKAGMEALFDAIVAITHPTAVGPSGPPINAAAFTALKAQLGAKLSAIVFGK